MNIYQKEYTIPIGRDSLILGQISNLHVWDTGRHCNAAYELHIILRGNCRLEVEDQLLTLKDTQAILIAPGQYHHPKTTSVDFERLFVHFTPSKGTLRTALRKHIPVQKAFPVTPDILQICRSIARESTAGNEHQQEMIQALLTQLMLHTDRLLQLTKTPSTGTDPHKEDSRISQIDNFFEDNFHCHAGRARLAKQLHLSERQLLRLLQETYGMGYQEKLINARMDHASWLLRTTEQPVAEISSRVGYASETAFFRVFKDYYQMTPQQYRTQFQQNETIKNGHGF